MKKYKVYQHADGKTIVAKIGFCWPAFFLTGIWAFVKRLWPVFFVSIFSLIVIKLLGNFSVKNNDLMTATFTMLILIIFHLVFGLFGNTWHMLNLEKRGYKMLGACLANNADEALAHVLAKK